MQQQGRWLPIIASVGVGAVTYYNMTNKGQGMGQTMQQMVPFVAGMSGQNAQQGATQQQTSSALQQNPQQFS
jgi:hypothetical protein